MLQDLKRSSPPAGPVPVPASLLYEGMYTHVIRLTQLVLVGHIMTKQYVHFHLLNKDFGILGISKLVLLVITKLLNKQLNNLVKVKNGPVEAVRENGSFQAVGFNR
jgi:hypothetical protein